MTAKMLQTMINTLTLRVEEHAKTALPKDYRVLECSGWTQKWTDRNGQTIEFNLKIAPLKPSANHNSILEIVTEIMEENQICGLVTAHTDGLGAINYRCCL